MSEKPIPSSRMGSLFSTKKETQVMNHESRVMNAEQNPESQFGRPQSRIMNHESLLMRHESGIVNIDPQLLNSAIAQGRKDPRISAYSPLVMSVLRYLRKTTPEFSMSEVASGLLEDAIRRKYPEISDLVEKTLSEKR